MSKTTHTIYHHPKTSDYTRALCGQWTMFKELGVSKVGVTCKKCLKKLATQRKKVSDD